MYLISLILIYLDIRQKHDEDCDDGWEHHTKKCLLLWMFVYRRLVLVYNVLCDDECKRLWWTRETGTNVKQLQAELSTRMMEYSKNDEDAMIRYATSRLVTKMVNKNRIQKLINGMI